MGWNQTAATVSYENDDVREYYSECHDAYRKRWEREGHRSIHYGYYPDPETDHGEAIPRMKREIADRADVSAGDRVLDAGCGIGETGTWLARERDAEVVGINISEMQLGIARDMADERGVADDVTFRFDDFTEMETVADDSVDVVWGLESICYAEDKRDVLEQAQRVLRDGGRIVVADGYLTAPADELSPADRRRMRGWLDGWKVPNLAARESFLADLRDLGFVDATADDVTESVLPSARSLYEFSLWGYPLTKLLQLVGARNQVQVDNVRACYYQYKTLYEGVWEYDIVSARLPA